MIASLKQMVTWLAGALAAVTALLYGCGFVALRAHLNLLGTSAWIDVPTQDYLETGGQILATLPIFLAAGLLLTSIPVGLGLYAAGLYAAKKRWLSSRALLWSVAVAGFLLFLGWGALLPPTGLLLTEQGSANGLWGRWLLEGEAGRRTLLVTYSLCTVAAVAMIGFAAECSRWIIEGRALTLVRAAIVLLGCVYALSLPLNYGILVIPLRFPEAEVDLNGTPVSGFLLNRNLSDPEEPIVLAVSDGSRYSVLVTARDDAKKVKILRARYIFPR